MFITGKFLNVDGLEKRPQYWSIPDEKGTEFRLAIRRGKNKSLLALVTDRRNYVRMANVQPKTFSRVPKDQQPVGELVAICHTSNGQPISLAELVQRLPENSKNITIAKIAAIHLADDFSHRLNPSKHNLPK